jgi:purine nucleoside permease
MMQRKITRRAPPMHRSDVSRPAATLADRPRAASRLNAMQVLNAPFATLAALVISAACLLLTSAPVHAQPGRAPSPLSSLPSLSLSGDLSTGLPPPAAGPKHRKKRKAPRNANMAEASFEAGGNGADEGNGRRIAPRVLILTMFEPEALPWMHHLGPWNATAIAGLPKEFPLLRCNRQQVCMATTGMGHSNAAASTMALALSSKLDLRYTYILVAGIAGINPEQGTLGTAAWARFLVDFGLQWQLDSREVPESWPSGYLGINTRSPSEKPALDYNTEVYQLNGALLRKVLHMTLNIPLVDGPQARKVRAQYSDAPANQPPRVMQCDSLSSDTWISGKHLGERATTWMQMLTNGRGSYCTNQQEDNATFEALMRGARMGRIDISRVMVLRAGADFDRPPPGVTALSNLLDYTEQGGFDIAVENLYRTASPVVQAISGNWRAWRDGIPAN